MHTQPDRLPLIHLYLTVQTVVIILASFNRLGAWTEGYVAANEFLRWVDFNNMLVLPLISLVAFYLLKKQLEWGRTTRFPTRHLLVNLLFVMGVYLLGSGYGNHEVTNYLHERFCTAVQYAPQSFCHIVIFNDDDFSHWIFFVGFTFMNLAMLLIQVLFPTATSLSPLARLLFIANGLFIALGIFANLAFEPIGFDLYVVALLSLVSFLFLLRPKGNGMAQPLLIYFATAYTIGLIATGIYKAQYMFPGAL